MASSRANDSCKVCHEADDLDLKGNLFRGIMGRNQQPSNLMSIVYSLNDVRSREGHIQGEERERKTEKRGRDEKGR